MEIWTASLYACIMETKTFKPGNIYPGREGYADLLLSGFILGNTIHKICDDMDHSPPPGIGSCIHQAVIDRTRSVPTNTNLGIILLHIPLALAVCRGGINHVAETLDQIIHSATYDDAIDVMKAMRKSGAFMGTPEDGPDVRSEKGMQEVLSREFTLLDLFFISKKWDTIASEWVNGFPITFSGVEDLLRGKSILQLYLEILAEYPDSLIKRKYGVKTAEIVSKKAKILLETFSLDQVRRWDVELHDHRINPGTTADLVSAAIFVALMKDDTLLERLLMESKEIHGI